MRRRSITTVSTRLSLRVNVAPSQTCDSSKSRFYSKILYSRTYGEWVEFRVWYIWEKDSLLHFATYSTAHNHDLNSVPRTAKLFSMPFFYRARGCINSVFYFCLLICVQDAIRSPCADLNFFTPLPLLSKKVYVQVLGGTVVVPAVRESTVDWTIVVVTVLATLMVKVDVPKEAVESASVLEQLALGLPFGGGEGGYLHSSRRKRPRNNGRHWSSSSSHGDSRSAIGEIRRSVLGDDGSSLGEGSGLHQTRASR